MDKKSAIELLEEKYSANVGEYDRWIKLEDLDIITGLNEKAVKKVLSEIPFKLVKKRKAKWSEVLEKVITDILEVIQPPP